MLDIRAKSLREGKIGNDDWQRFRHFNSDAVEFKGKRTISRKMRDAAVVIASPSADSRTNKLHELALTQAVKLFNRHKDVKPVALHNQDELDRMAAKLYKFDTQDQRPISVIQSEITQKTDEKKYQPYQTLLNDAIRYFTDQYYKIGIFVDANAKTVT